MGGLSGKPRQINLPQDSNPSNAILYGSTVLTLRHDASNASGI